jgi:hypothetical protein
MSGLKVQETEKWGRETARSRYGKLEQPDMRPPDAHRPQKLGDASNLQGNFYDNNVRNDWRRGAGESAEGMPNFQRGYRGKK